MGDLPQVSGDPGALRELPPEQNTREDPEAETKARLVPPPTRCG